MTFGANRRDPASYAGHVTPLGGRYGYIRSRYDHRADGEIEDPNYGLLQASDGDLPPQTRFRIHDEIGGEPVSLTSIVLSTNPHEDRDSELYSNLRALGFEDLGEPFHISHTEAADVPRIMAHAESLFRHALNPNIGTDIALTTMGELHWWLAHAMPDERGSAAKAEFCVRSIAQARGMDLPPFQHGVVPDLEAMTTPRAEFVSQYPRLFEQA